MRSLVQEAANIQKAIEQAWNKAGNPTEFQVKILEEPERNFFGMVTRSAKVAIIFEEKQPQRDKKKQADKHKKQKRSAQESQTKQQPEQQQKQKHSHDQQQYKDKQKQQSREQEQAQPQQRKEEQQKAAAREQDTQKAEHKQQKQQQQQSPEKQEKTADKQEGTSKREKPKSLWTPERVEYAQKWLRELLNTMGYENISFTAEPQNLYLRIELSDHLLTRRDQEKQLLASLASLMMATMQRNYKKAFRGHKVVLTHP